MISLKRACKRVSSQFESVGPGVLLLVSVSAAPQEAQSAFEVTSVKRDLSKPGQQYRMSPGFIVERRRLISR
jgi:hypothetical protein